MPDTELTDDAIHQGTEFAEEHVENVLHQVTKEGTTIGDALHTAQEYGDALNTAQEHAQEYAQDASNILDASINASASSTLSYYEDGSHQQL